MRAWARAAPLVALLAWACAVNPATGRRQLVLFGEDREIAMGREADRAFAAQLGEVDAPELTAYVRDLGLRLAAVSERPDLPWSVRVLDDPTVNAFALPGGFLFVTRGLLASLDSEAELAGVLGHEIGHVTARHSAERLSRQQLQSLGLGLGMVLSTDLRRVGDLVSTGLALVDLRFSRGDELEADHLGARYMARAGY
ncbi:MAG: peptidase M48, partial [Gemmatimonadetes bacterium]